MPRVSAGSAGLFVLFERTHGPSISLHATPLTECQNSRVKGRPTFTRRLPFQGCLHSVFDGKLLERVVRKKKFKHVDKAMLAARAPWLIWISSAHYT